MSLTVAIVGRPNVGKSTLFNRLVGKRQALVDDTPGVTRDRRDGEGRLADLRFSVIDTAGLEDVTDDSLESRMRTQTEAAVELADVALLLIDARAGVTPLDAHFARWLRTLGGRTIVIANKCEGGAGQPGYIEAFGLGLGDPLPLSAEHAEGLSDLYDALKELTEQVAEVAAEAGEAPPDTEAGDDAEYHGGPLRLAIIGRPNVGKSTLVNRLLDEDRMVTGPEAGITRDSIAIPWRWRDRDILLADTAGLRRKARIQRRLEKLSAADSLRTIRFAHVVVMLEDAATVMERQDLALSRLVIDEGRALVIAINKWDAAEDRRAVLARVRDRLLTSLPQARGVPVVTLSAKTGRGVEKLMPAVLKAHDIWNTRVSTGELNRWLAALLEHHPPPLAAGRRIRIRYMTQVKARPPTFVAFTSRPDALPASYARYLVNGLRDTFGLEGVPIRLHTRKGKNPYVGG